MTDTPPKLNPAPRSPRAVIIVSLVTACVLLIALDRCSKTTERAINAGGTQAVNVIHAMGDALEKFSQGSITTTFQESLPSLSRDRGGRLELASMTVTETFSKTDNLTTAWGWLDLGSTVSEIRVPATYRYFLRLHDDWKLDVVASNICVVHAPAIHAGLPPAINTTRMEKKSARGWARFNADEQMSELEKSITGTLVTYAGDPRHLASVREECRKTVAEFVRDWLLREHQWRDDRFTSIKVIFADEKPPAADDLPVTLELKNR